MNHVDNAEKAAMRQEIFYKTDSELPEIGLVDPRPKPCFFGQINYAEYTARVGRPFRTRTALLSVLNLSLLTVKNAKDKKGHPSFFVLYSVIAIFVSAAGVRVKRR